ncbi:hypothetical protein J2Y63_003760 [Shinella sp. BE166]
MTRIIAVALCCLPLVACGTADWLSERQRDRQYDTNQGALEYMKSKKEIK